MNLKHGGTGTRTYQIWAGLHYRCYVTTSPKFAAYGGRGITVCAAWADFPTFRADMGECPPGMTLDRIDNDGPYSPNNCRWATMLEQSNNKRNNRLITHDGRTQTLASWAREVGLRDITIAARIDRYGYDVARALSKQTGRKACK